MGNISPADMTFCLLAQFHDLLVEKSSKNKIGLSSNIPQKIFWSQELPEASACRTFGPRWREVPRRRTQNLQHQACLPSSSAEVICLFLSLFFWIYHLLGVSLICKTFDFYSLWKKEIVITAIWLQICHIIGAVRKRLKREMDSVLFFPFCFVFLNLYFAGLFVCILLFGR